MLSGKYLGLWFNPLFPTPEDCLCHRGILLIWNRETMTGPSDLHQGRPFTTSGPFPSPSGTIPYAPLWGGSLTLLQAHERNQDWKSCPKFPIFLPWCMTWDLEAGVSQTLSWAPSWCNHLEGRDRHQNHKCAQVIGNEAPITMGRLLKKSLGSLLPHLKSMECKHS